MCFVCFHVNIPPHASMLGLIFPTRKNQQSQSLALLGRTQQAEFDFLSPYPLALNGPPDLKRIRVSVSKEVSRVTIAQTRQSNRPFSLATCQRGGCPHTYTYRGSPHPRFIQLYFDIGLSQLRAKSHPADAVVLRCIIYFSVERLDNHISLFLLHSVGLLRIGPDEGVNSKIGVICIAW